MLHPQLSSKHQKGFTLIEITIVLVIIGLLVGGVLAGKDLMTNARAKSLAAWARGWEQSLYAHLDRTGRLPDDGNANGLMGSPGSETPRSSLHNSTLEDVPPAAEQFGSVQLTLLLGNGGSHAQLNVLALVATETLGTAAFGQKPLPLLQSLDTIIDGSVDPQFGLFRGYTSIETSNSETVTALSSPAATYDEAVAAAYFFDGAPAGDAVVYENDFEDPNDASYTIWRSESRWNDSSGTMTGDAGYLTFNHDRMTDMTIQGTINLSNGSDGGAILYRATGDEGDYLPTQGYGFQIDPGLGDKFVIRSFSGNSEDVLYSENFPTNFDPYTEHEFEISISGNTHSILIDGENGHEITYTEDNDDPLYTSGYAGLRTWDGDVSFDDIKVEPN